MMTHDSEQKLDITPPPPPPQITARAPERPSSDYMSDSINSMKQSLELDGQLALTYRAQVLSELQKNDQKRNTIPEES